MNLRAVLQLVLIFFALVVLGISLEPQWLGYWADSEIWAVATSRQIFTDSRAFDFSMKPVFHCALWLADRLLPASPIHSGAGVMEALDRARLLMALSQIATLASLLALSKIWSKSFVPGLIAVALLLSSEFYFDQALRIRSDLMAVPFILWALHAALCGRGRLFLVMGLLAFWITPKTALLGFALLATREGRAYLRAPLKSLSQVFNLKYFVNLCVLIGVVGLFALQGFGLVKALEHFTAEMSAESMGFSYFAPIRFSYLLTALRTDPWFWALALLVPWLGFLPATLRPSWITAREKPWMQMNLLVLLILLLNPSKLPFLIASYQPLLVLAMGFALAGFVPKRQSDTRFGWGQIAGFIVASLLLVLSFSINFTARRNLPHSFYHFAQESLGQDLVRYVQLYPRAKVYDGIGLLTDRPLSAFFIGPGQRVQNSLFTEYLKIEKPGLLIYTQKVSLMRDEIDPILQDDYISSPSGLYRRAVKFKISKNKPVTADQALSALRETFKLEFYGSSKVFFDFGPEDSEASFFPLGLSAEDFKDHWPPPSVVEGDVVSVTLYAPFEPSVKQSFADVFRFQPAKTSQVNP